MEKICKNCYAHGRTDDICILNAKRVEDGDSCDDFFTQPSNVSATYLIKPPQIKWTKVTNH